MDLLDKIVLQHLLNKIVQPGYTTMLSKDGSKMIISFASETGSVGQSDIEITGDKLERLLKTVKIAKNLVFDSIEDAIK